MDARTVETRSYRIVELLGEGGFGRVYRARMEGAAGFSKDVAIKLLTDRSPPEDVLARFRDESRILGLVRDRAVVAVEPTTQLGGRWAVIMEFVPGASCQELLSRHGPLPPRVVLGVVEEVARALDHVFRQPGPDGQPLELVHRDLKPANLQVTQAGEVKILDFGVARARYEAREATTTRSIQGTYGYIAPERLHGVDTPAADVYALGMVLYKLVTNGTTDPKALAAALDAASGPASPVLALARNMVAPEPQDRPTAREVEDLCRALASSTTGPDLRRWAEEHVVRDARDDPKDDLVGKVLTATLEIGERTAEISVGPSRAGCLVLAGLTGVNLVLVSVALGVAIAVAVLAVWQPWARPPAPPPEPEPVAAPAPPPVVEAPAAEPTPEPVPQAPPAPEPAVVVSVDFGSQPLGAEVLLDDVPIGRTPIVGHAVPAGKHRVVMRSAGETGVIDVDVGRRKPRRFVWRGDDRWDVLY